jgi:hypothetical protein
MLSTFLGLFLFSTALSLIATFSVIALRALMRRLRAEPPYPHRR